jgi:predicted Zn-dependent protease
LKTDLYALRLYLELLIGGGKYATAERFLKAGIAENLLDTQSIVPLRALIHEGSQNDVAAERIYQTLYRQHPGESAYALNYLRILIRLGKSNEARTVLQPLLKDPAPEILREASQVYADLGDYKEAERLQARVMGLPGTPRFQDWSHLGDIRYSAGNRSAARRAYRQALASAEQNSHSPPP